MIKRLFALLLLGTLLVSLAGCNVLWGNERGHKSADWISEKKELFSDTNRHALTHVEVALWDFRDMHRFWDRYFMNYDWDDPYQRD